jgi:outer membrane receptor for ferrienterochelin and colicin
LSTLDTVASPLILVDGKVHHGSLDSLDPDTIKAINLLKGPTAIKKYGKAAAGGVIEITTKK